MTLHASRSFCAINVYTLALTGVALLLLDPHPVKAQRSFSEASDLPVAPEDMAREILQLQQQLGGSVVEKRTDLQGWRPEPPSTHGDQVLLLRETAFQLDEAAHRLELQDLYEQADALRNVATRLRHDARELKRAFPPQQLPAKPPTPPQSTGPSPLQYQGQ